MHKFDFRINDNRAQSWWEVREKERACACICVCGEKRAWELTQQASEESQVQEKSRMADAALESNASCQEWKSKMVNLV